MMLYSVELLYLVSGAILPLFYLPQILRFRSDQTLLASYSLSKSLCQLVLRAPALLFALLVVQNLFMDFVLALDLAGRAVELVAAVLALRRQGATRAEILRRAFPAVDQLIPVELKSVLFRRPVIAHEDVAQEPATRAG